MAAKAVVGEDAAQIRMTGEQDAVHVERFALEPVGAREDAVTDGTGSPRRSCKLHADAVVPGQGQ